METPQLRAALLADGMTPLELRSAVKAGELERVRHGVYASQKPSDRPSGRRAAHRRLVEATLPLVHSDSVVSHMSAAIVHGLPVRWTDLDQVHVTRPGPTHGRRGRGLVLHTSRLEPDEVVVADGVPSTTLARTVADLAIGMPFEWGVVMADAALRLGTPREELMDAVARYPRRPHLARARRVIAFADPGAESPAESMSRAQLALALIPLPSLQVPILRNGTIVARGDLAWEEIRLVAEVDGALKYGPREDDPSAGQRAILAEKKREEQLRLAGWWPTRWGWDLACDRKRLAAHVLRAMEVAKGRL